MKKAATNPIFIMVRVSENMAGQNHQFPELVSIPIAEKAAPVTGPTMKPIANATPTKA